MGALTTKYWVQKIDEKVHKLFKQDNTKSLYDHLVDVFVEDTKNALENDSKLHAYLDLADKYLVRVE